VPFNRFSVSKLLVGDGDELFSDFRIKPASLARFGVLSFGFQLLDGLLLSAGSERQEEQNNDGKGSSHVFSLAGSP
jgi:hypothetical protein